MATAAAMLGSVLQLPCCPCGQGELSEMCLQNLLLNLPPHAVDKLKANTMEYDDAEAYEVSVD